MMIFCLFFRGVFFFFMWLSKAAEMRGRRTRQLAASTVVCDKEELQSRVSSPPLCPSHPPAAGRGSARAADNQKAEATWRHFVQTSQPK